MTPTRKNLLLIICIGAVVFPGVFLFFTWSARLDGGTKPEVACWNNLREIETAEQMWAMENHKTTNDTPTWANLQGYLRSTNFTCPAGGTYRLERIGEPPGCSVSAHAALYRKTRLEAGSSGK
jgi:hypothetical protein